MLIADPAAVADGAEVLVVGAGAVGLTLAIDLARRGRRVLVLDGGPAGLRRDYGRANAALERGRPHGGLVDARYKGLGGTTRLWGGQLARFDASDLAADSYPGKPGWPIEPAVLDCWVDRALRLLGVEPDAAAAQWTTSMAADPLDPDLTADLTLWLPQPDFTRLFRADIAAAAGPAIALDHEVIALTADTAEGRITGVKVRDAGGAETIIDAPQVVLAAGTAESVRLLLRAQRLLAGAPLAANRHVGRWFFDHLHGPVGTIAAADRHALAARFDTRYDHGRKAVPKLRAAPKLRQRLALSNAALTVNSRLTPGAALRDLRALGRRAAGRDALRATAMLAPLAWRYLVRGRSGHFLSGSAALGMELEQVPTADSRFFLEEGVPPEAARIGLHWAIDGREVAAAQAVAMRFAEAVAARGLGACTLDPRLVAGDPALLDDFHPSSHQMGGARMAARVTDGVTAPDGQVWNMPRLWVAGAASFPTGGFANPTLTAIALGLRIADALDRAR